jgi:hypothetical protein
MDMTIVEINVQSRVRHFDWQAWIRYLAQPNSATRKPGLSVKTNTNSGLSRVSEAGTL